VCTGSKGSFGNISTQPKYNLCNEAKRTFGDIKSTSSSQGIIPFDLFNNSNGKSFILKDSNDYYKSGQVLELNDKRLVEANRGAAAEQMNSSLELDTNYP
jgi:hypothetical protein